MTVTLTITEDDVFTAVRAFLLTAITAPTIEVVQGQVNQVAEPLGDFVVMWPTRRARLATNVETWNEPTLDSLQAAQSTQFDIQCDIHGERGADLAQTISTLWRSTYACDLLAPASMAPLYNTDPSQMPFINAEKQYENRWVVVLSLQANPVVSTTQQFADTLDITLVEVDTTYPPGDVAP